MNQKEFNDAAKEAAQILHMDSARLLSAMLSSENPDPEFVRKTYNDTKDVSGAVQQRLADPYAGLPVLNITIVNGVRTTQVKEGSEVTATVIPPEDQPVDPDVIDVEPLPALPAPVPRVTQIEPVDLSELMGLLDDPPA